MEPEKTLNVVENKLNDVIILLKELENDENIGYSNSYSIWNLRTKIDNINKEINNIKSNICYYYSK